MLPPKNKINKKRGSETQALKKKRRNHKENEKTSHTLREDICNPYH